MHSLTLSDHSILSPKHPSDSLHFKQSCAVGICICFSVMLCGVFLSRVILPYVSVWKHHRVSIIVSGIGACPCYLFQVNLVIIWLLPGYLLHFCPCISFRLNIFWEESFKCWLVYLFLQLHSCLDTGINSFCLHIPQERNLDYNTSLSYGFSNLTTYWPGFSSALGEHSLSCAKDELEIRKFSSARWFVEELDLQEC